MITSAIIDSRESAAIKRLTFGGIHNRDGPQRGRFDGRL